MTLGPGPSIGLNTTMSTILRRPRRLPPRAAGIVMPLVLSIIMTFVVSAISTLRSLGPVPEVLKVWPTAWALSWLVAFPTLLLVLPLVRRIVGLIVEPPAR